jgi:hypothetical protein
VKSLAIALALLALPVGADSRPPIEEAINGFAQQRAAWNAGDLEGALATYLDDPAMTWVNAKGMEHGLKTFAESMRSEYADKRNPMGTYEGEVLDAREMGATRALLVVRWSINHDGRRIMGGYSTQLWERRGKSWVVVFEHAS